MVLFPFMLFFVAAFYGDDKRVFRHDRIEHLRGIFFIRIEYSLIDGIIFLPFDEKTIKMLRAEQFFYFYALVVRIAENNLDLIVPLRAEQAAVDMADTLHGDNEDRRARCNDV